MQALAGQLSAHPAAGRLFLRRLKTDPARLETVASLQLRGPEAPARARTPLLGSTASRLIAFCLSGALERVRPGRESWASPIVPEGIAEPCLVGPLTNDDGPLGVVVLVAAPGSAFGRADEEALLGLLGPLAFAISRDRLLHTVHRLEEAVEADRRSLSQPLDVSASIVGAETGLREVMERVQLVAQTDAPVLILGETGSGKEVIARALHAGSARRSGPVMRVNCGAIPSELIDSELFGHERGSFTGAVADREGWFERADGGTLFLDEVAELSLAAQVRLLRILQDGSFERVGGQQTKTVDVRLVAATHRDLGAMVRDRLFREDLYYRINIFPIRLPSLRERREDIPALAAHFSRKAGLRLGASPLLPSPEDVDLLLGYEWPGNVRELAAVIERAAILGNGRRLDLRRALGPSAQEAALPGPVRSTPTNDDRDFPSLDDVTVLHIQAALTRAGGRVEGPSGAAKLLGVNPHTLRARMRKLGVDWKRFRAVAAPPSKP